MKIIGRSDFIDFPDLGLNFVSVKVDTGAFNSSLHCERTWETVDKTGNNILVVDFGNDNIKYFDDYETNNITSSNGQVSVRYVILTKVKVLGDTYYMKVNLNNRSTMKSECLLGRTFLSNNKILVYVREKNLSIKNVDRIFNRLSSLTITVGGQNVFYNNINDLLIKVQDIIINKEFDELSNYSRSSYLSRMKAFTIHTDKGQVTLDKIASFVIKTNERFRIDSKILKNIEKEIKRKNKQKKQIKK